MIEAIVRVAEQGMPPGVTVSAARGLHSILEADRRLLRSQTSSAGLAVAAIWAVLAVLWRSPRLALVAVVTNLVPVALVLAGAGFAQVPLNSITVMVGAIALGVVEDDTVHFLTHWRDRRRAGVSARAALHETLRVKGPPILWTTVVLVGVFALFGFSSFPPVVHFGLLLAGAFVAAQLTLLAVLPAWLGRTR
jgi:predicted RND superfamily exporter protein